MSTKSVERILPFDYVYTEFPDRILEREAEEGSEGSLDHLGRFAHHPLPLLLLFVHGARSSQGGLPGAGQGLLFLFTPFTTTPLLGRRDAPLVVEFARSTDLVGSWIIAGR